MVYLPLIYIYEMYIMVWFRRQGANPGDEYHVGQDRVLDTASENSIESGLSGMVFRRGGETVACGAGAGFFFPTLACAIASYDPVYWR
jgi:hypothetical protein